MAKQNCSTMRSVLLQHSEKWGFLRENEKKAKEEGVAPLTGLHRTGLDRYLQVIYHNVSDWIHDKSIQKLNGEKCGYRPDYRSETLKLIVEFDGLQHYNNPKNIIEDEEKTCKYEADGYKVIRIPYFIQLTQDVVREMFGVEVKEKLFNPSIPSLYIEGKNTPAFLCPLGIKRMAKEFIRYPEQCKINVQSLQGKDERLTGLEFLMDELSKIDNTILAELD